MAATAVLKRLLFSGSLDAYYELALSRTQYLVVYALAFSFAYRELTAGTGALLLFGLVQLTMLLVAVRVRPGVAAVVGFVLGLIGDSLAPESFGAGALAMCLVGFSASWLKAVFFSDNVFLHAIFFFAGKWAFDVIFVVAARSKSLPTQRFSLSSPGAAGR